MRIYHHAILNVVEDIDVLAMAWGEACQVVLLFPKSCLGMRLSYARPGDAYRQAVEYADQ